MWGTNNARTMRATPGVQLRDPGVASSINHRPPIPLSTLPQYNPTPSGRPPLPATGGHSPRLPPHLTPAHGRSKGKSPVARPGDIVLLQNSPLSGNPKVQRLPPHPPFTRPLPPSTQVAPLRQLPTPTPVPNRTANLRQAVNGPRVTPAPKASVVHAHSFRAAVSQAAFPSPAPALHSSSPRPVPVGASFEAQNQTLKRKSTVRGPRPAPPPSDSKSTQGTLQRRRAVSRISRVSTTSSSKRSLPIPPTSPNLEGSDTMAQIGNGPPKSPESGSDGSPDLTIQWLPDQESARAGTDEAEETWRKMEMRMGTKLRDSKRQRGRWIVTPRLGGETPLLGSVGFREAVPTGCDHVPIADHPHVADRLLVDIDAYEETHDERGDAPTRSGSEESSASSAFTLSAYFASSSEGSSDSSDPSQSSIEGLPAMFDMTQPLICGSHDKTPMNTPVLHNDSLKRADRVSKRPEGLLEVEYLGGGGMLIRDESIRSVIGRVDAISSRIVGAPIKISREVESARLDTQVLDALRVLASPPGSSLSSEGAGASPETELDLELYADYVTSPPVAVQWISRPITRLPPPSAERNAPIPTPRSIASAAIDEMYGLLQHHQEELSELSETSRTSRNSPRPQYTDRLYRSPESIDLPPLSLAPLPLALPGATDSSSGLGLGLNIRMDSVYGVPSLANARVRLLSPRVSEDDSSPLPFEKVAASPIGSPLDLCPPEEEPLHTLVIRDLDTGNSVNLDLASIARASPTPPAMVQRKDKEKWWSKKLFGK